MFHLISLPRAAMAEREMSTCIQTGDVVTHKSWILLRINKARIILCDSYSWNVAKKKKEKEEDSSQSNATVGGMCHLSENQKKKKKNVFLCVSAGINNNENKKHHSGISSKVSELSILSFETVFFFLHTVWKTRPCPHVC